MDRAARSGEKLGLPNVRNLADSLTHFDYLCYNYFERTMTLNTILKELKDLPADRLDELHQFIQSLIPTSKQTERDRKKILSYGGSFGTMSKKDYAAFVRHTKRSRAKLFDRTVDL